jgi:hypothetical protein
MEKRVFQKIQDDGWNKKAVILDFFKNSRSFKYQTLIFRVGKQFCGINLSENARFSLFVSPFFLEHIFKKWALLKSLCRPSICPSVTYFSAGIAPRELKF